MEDKVRYLSKGGESGGSDLEGVKGRLRSRYADSLRPVPERSETVEGKLMQ
jgi:hypothetical protein